MKSKLSWLEAPLLLAPFIVLAIYWQQLPARVPMHWNLNGEVDRWAPKLSGLLLLPLLAVGLVALLHFLPRLDPKLQKTDGVQGRMGTGLAATRLGMLLLLNIIFYMQIAVSLGREVNVVRVVVVATLVFLAIIGNYLGTLRPNYFVGIRTPWTLEDPQTWRATHRLGGRLMCFGALVLLVLEFVLTTTVFMAILVAAVLALVVWAFVYSWHHSRRRFPRSEQLTSGKT
jgi:uncharacterized membrane protein